MNNQSDAVFHIKIAVFFCFIAFFCNIFAEVKQTSNRSRNVTVVTFPKSTCWVCPGLVRATCIIEGKITGLKWLVLFFTPTALGCLGLKFLNKDGCSLSSHLARGWTFISHLKFVSFDVSTVISIISSPSLVEKWITLNTGIVTESWSRWCQPLRGPQMMPTQKQHIELPNCLQSVWCLLYISAIYTSTWQSALISYY